MMNVLNLNFKISGAAGEGIMTAAKNMARILAKLRYKVFNYYEYPSLIKGGQQTGQVYASATTATCQKKTLDVLVVLNDKAIKLHQEEIVPQTIVIGEFKQTAAQFDRYQIDQETIQARFYNLPLSQLALATTGLKIAINSVATGAAAYLAGVTVTAADLQEIFAEDFVNKDQALVTKIVDSFMAGYQAAQALSVVPVRFNKQIDRPEQLLVTGNEAIGLGALAAGLQFYSAYPMTPASGLMHFLALQQHHYPLIVKHAEDEIAAINQAIGAAYAGVRAMTGSAGGGFALMVESLSLLGIAELPLVILVAQRGAPGTGLPTWTAQADLQFVLRAGHGDFWRIVLTPGTIEEHFLLTQQAFVWAEKYQLPVIILSDKFALESQQTLDRPQALFEVTRYGLVNQTELATNGSYRRYDLTASGVSPRSIPGQANGLGLTNSYEHDQAGLATETALIIKQQIDKRTKKIDQLLTELPLPQRFGPEQAELTFVSWGSTINVLLELLWQVNLRQSNGESIKNFNFIHLPCLWPFPRQLFLALVKSSQQLVMIEANVSGQAEQLIRQETGVEFADVIHRYDGRPFYWEDLIEYLKK